MNNNNTYKINITKVGPDHWIINTVLNIAPLELKMESTVGGKTIREGIINAIEDLNNRVQDDPISKLVELAIRDLESIL